MIEIRQLTKRYGRFTALSRLDLTVESGQVFGLLGPNGAGKTTTMKCIAGLVRPNSGDVLVAGHSVQREPIEAKRRLGVIPDRPYLYEKLTGLEYLCFASGLYGLPQGEGERRGRALLELFGLTPWADELVEGYSHGMKQRLVMAGALVHTPQVLVIDEPMVGLDPAGAQLVKRLFRELARRGLTVVLSTHSLPVAQEVCDRIAIVSAGRLVAMGTLDELRARAAVEGDLEAVFMRLTREADPGDGSSGAEGLGAEAADQEAVETALDEVGFPRPAREVAGADARDGRAEVAQC